MKKINNLNEEINRIKSLFTEERMFGNLVEEKEVITENNIKKGSEGEEVVALQQLLGINPADGKFGPQTDTEVKKFQKENGLTADGIVGPKTLEKIESMYEKKGGEAKGDGSKEESKNKDEKVNEWRVLSDKELFSEQTEVKGLTLAKAKGFLQKLKNIIKPNNQNTQQSNSNNQNTQQSNSNNQNTQQSNSNNQNTQQQGDDDKVKKVRNSDKPTEGEFIKDKEGNISSKDLRKGTKDEKGDLSVFFKSLDKLDNINDKASCRRHLLQMAKAANQGVSKQDVISKGGEEHIKKIESCLSKFYNVWEREGYFNRKHKIKTLMGSWNIKQPEKLEKGYKGGLYKIKDESGNVVGQIKKTRDNKFLFKGKLNVPLIDKSVSPAVFREPYIDGVYDAINVDRNKDKIVIQKSMDKKKIDMGTFAVFPK